MNYAVVRYNVKEDRISENLDLIEKVFTDLERTAPDDLRYLVLGLADGSFLHIVATHEGKASPSLTELPAFKAFGAAHADRRSGELNRSPAKIIGNYRMFSGTAGSS